MKRLLLVAALACALPALAQEIGTEITPVTPTSTPTPPPPAEPPPATPPPQKGGYVYKPQGAKSAPSSSSASSSGPEQPTWTGTKLSAASGDFGIRGGFGASGSTAVPSTSTGATIVAPTVGIAYLGTDSFKLLADLGAGFLLIGSNTLIALNAAVGFDYFFRTPADALRPFFHFAGSFNMTIVGSSDPQIGFGAQLGFGAEYFLSPNLSFNGRLLLSVPMSLAGGNFNLGIYTVTPGVGATWYF